MYTMNKIDSSANQFAKLVAVVMLSIFLAACAGGRTSKSTGDMIDDSVITTKVKAEIANDLGIATAANINIETYKGTVQLGGFVDDAATRQRAEAAARRVKGVTNVENRLSLK